jgi:uncharacterized protein YfiM (DUF2279 family)
VKKYFFIFFLLFFFGQKKSLAQDIHSSQIALAAESSYLPYQHFENLGDSLRPHPKRLKTFVIAGSAFYATTLTGLYFLWYQDGLESKFRFANDNADWQQIDKVGHFYSTFHFSNATAEGFRWAGLKEKKAIFWGAVTGIGVMLPIEIFDGFSADYGASWGDLLANTSGAAFLYGQYLLWDEVRIQPKFSFHRTHYAPLRPGLLGQNLQEEILKDYNGQTYWLSFDMAKFLPETKFPKWLNVAVGYGGEGMTYANPTENRELGGNQAYRQFYLSPDFNIMAIPARRKFFKVLRFVANLIKIPAPALEFNQSQGFRFHFLYF